MYHGPIIDPHQHFWQPQQNPHPWLQPDAQIPFRYGNYEAIKRDYLPPDYLRDAATHRVEATVYMEAEWDPAAPLSETRYIHQLAKRFGYPNAVIAQAWLDRTDVSEVLEWQAAYPLVRSVRHKPGGAASWQQARSGEHSLMSNPRWLNGYAELQKYALHFDLQTPWWHLDEACRLARDFPHTTLILNHCGLPADRSAEGLTAWRQAMSSLADYENVAVKISGLGERDHPWSVSRNQGIVRDTLAMFGTHRCMFASNFPVDSLCVTFDTLYTGFKKMVEHLPYDMQYRLFYDNALRYYRPTLSTAATPLKENLRYVPSA
ncbi:amidohydrolase [Pantoea sp. GM01]|uniref:amidohydrolase family protein n=1 Tax=Pantoea sp. GM01 TaxID=1144320 RepID=UPI0002711608|nr:amidohydrolase family protein [Pantoea sp. GM01]EJL92532.1 putative TIM-barrel fold metal-dependent hydrolase [Pantoea sp. GM01]